MPETAHRTVPGFRIARIRKVARPADETARSACLSADPAVPFPPPWGGRSPPYSPAGSGSVPRPLTRYASSLAGATFTPAQPPSVINSPFEKTNLTQKQPSCASQPPRAAAPSWTSNPYWCRPPPSPSRLACASPRRRTRPLTRRMRARHRERRRTLHAQRAFLSSYRRVRAETGRGYF